MRKISDVMYRMSIWVIALFVGTMTVITLAEIMTRNFMGFSFQWAGELTRFLFIWVTFIGASAVYKRLEMPSFDLLLNKVSPKVCTTIFRCMQVIVSLFCILVIYAGFTESNAPSVSLQKTPGLGISMTIPYLAIPVGMSLLLIHALSFLIAPPDKSKERLT